MLFWFVAGAVIAVSVVFDSPALDHRTVALGAVLPLVEVPWGEPRLLHSLTGAVLALAIVMAATVGHRLRRRRWLGVPIGMFFHLVLDAAWADSRAFWWPFLGSFSHHEIPELARGGVSVVLELVGIGLAIWWWRACGLDDPQRRYRLLHTGRAGRRTTTAS